MNRTLIYKSLICTLLLGLGLGLMSLRYQILYNTTPSVEGKWFLLDKYRAVTKGGYMVFLRPEDKYYPNTHFLKLVYGIAGDVISIKDNNFYINDNYIGESRGIAFEGTIPDAQFFVYGTHRRSYDSRRFGLIHQDSVIGIATRLF